MAVSYPNARCIVEARADPRESFSHGFQYLAVTARNQHVSIGKHYFPKWKSGPLTGRQRKPKMAQNIREKNAT